MSDLTSTIYWHETATDPPPPTRGHVRHLVWNDWWESTREALYSWDADAWRDLSGLNDIDRPTLWAEMPAPPKKGVEE